MKTTGVNAETLRTHEESKETKEEPDFLDRLPSTESDATSTAIKAWDQQRKAAALFAATFNQGRLVP